MTRTVLRKILGVAAAALLAALAVPSLAQPAKIYSLVVSPTALPAGQTTEVTVTFKNQVPNGNSSFNSLVLTAPEGVTIPAQAITTLSGTAVVVGNTVQVSNIAPVKPQKDFTFKFNVSVAADATCADGSWDTPTTTFVYTGSNFSGDVFTLQTNLSSVIAAVGCDGVLKCPSIPTAPGFTSYGPENTTSLLRWENKDGSDCIPVTFNLTFAPDNRELELTWNVGVQPYATIETRTNWPAETVHPDTQLPRRTRVQWVGAPGPVDAPTCLSARPPTVYGTLVGSMNGTDLTSAIQITAASLPAAPFPIVVPSNVAGTAPERMLVTSHAPSATSGVHDVNVVRASGLTTKSTHSSGAKVMSTPMPVFPGTFPDVAFQNRQAQACIFNEFFETPLDPAACAADQVAGVEPLGCVEVESHLFLIGDPIISRSY